MAKTTFIDPIASMSGRLNKREKRGAVMRQKHYRDDTGRVVAVGTNETYTVCRPRDYTANPPKGEELRSITLFQQAARMAADERRDPVRLAYWEARFQAQLKHPEPDAPIDPRTRRPRIYARLHIFIHATILRSLRQQPPSDTPHN